MDGFRIGRHKLQPFRQLLADGERVHLGARGLAILSVLAEARSEVVTKDELMEAVWPDITVEENALQVHVVALRKALDQDADRLETIRGVGYRLKVEEYQGGQRPPAPGTGPQNRPPLASVSQLLPCRTTWKRRQSSRRAAEFATGCSRVRP